MNYRIEYSIPARRDVERLVDFLANKDPSASRRALNAILDAVKLLELFPFSTRVAEGGNPFIRELVISFSNSGYVAMYAVRGEIVTILAIRHQLEDDYL
jgi:plasmid stabilization system protein ParE